MRITAGKIHYKEAFGKCHSSSTIHRYSISAFSMYALYTQEWAWLGDVQLSGNIAYTATNDSHQVVPMICQS